MTGACISICDELVVDVAREGAEAASATSRVQRGGPAPDDAMRVLEGLSTEGVIFAGLLAAEGVGDESAPS